MTPWRQYNYRYSGGARTRQWCTPSNGRFYQWQGTYLTGGGPWLDPDFDTLYSKVEDALDLQYFVQQAAARLASGGWDALTFVGEFSQLRRQFEGLLKKLDHLTVGQAAREIENKWLEGRYGWRTLVYDLQDLSDAIDLLHDRRSRYREQAGIQATIPLLELATAGTPVVRTDYEVNMTISQRGTVVADTGPSPFRFNPIITAWEVSRLSFVVDWLVNVGQALDAASFLFGVKQYASAGGYRADFVGTVTKSEGDNTGLDISNYLEQGIGDINGYIEERIPQTVSFKPRFKVRLDPWKAIDLLLIVRQRVRGLPRLPRVRIPRHLLRR